MINRGSALGLAMAAGGLVLSADGAGAQRVNLQADNRIENQVAVFAALDKVTARISKLEIPLGETVKFGALTVTPRSCFTRSPLEAPKTSSFVEVSENQLDGQTKRIFGGWMFAESPGLNAVEHPVYDVWLTDCAKPRGAAAAATSSGRASPAGAAPPARAAPQSGAPGQSGRVGQPQPGQPAVVQPPSVAPGDGDLNRRRPPR